jgi:hypothetical protein
MKYGEKLRENLKTEQNPINKMYLNDLILNWNKVELAIKESADSPISTIISSVSEFTKFLGTAKFKHQPNKKCGFPDTHDIFKPYYLYDIISLLLEEAMIATTEDYLKLGKREFSTKIRLIANPFKKQIDKPYLEIFTSDKYFNVGLEFDIQYRLTGRKNYSKSVLYIPLIIFYVEKQFTLESFKEISKLKRDMYLLNPHTLLFCICESVNKKLISHYQSLEDDLYILRGNFTSDPYRDFIPEVFQNIYIKLLNFAHNELPQFDKIVPFGHKDLVPNASSKSVSNIAKTTKEDDQNQEINKGDLNKSE